jgi:hypothetical protein
MQEKHTVIYETPGMYAIAPAQNLTPGKTRPQAEKKTRSDQE